MTSNRKSNTVSSRLELSRRLPEMIELEGLAGQCAGTQVVTTEAVIAAHGQEFSLTSFAFGSQDRSAPVVAFIGGVHGLERVGTNVAIPYLKMVIELLAWDKGLQHLLSRCRLVFFPLVNPAGMYAKTRSNAHGVDLMRNAPIEAEGTLKFPLLGGHRRSPRLPWYRGQAGAVMELEAQALERFVRREVFPSRFSLILDMHSGFGLVDRLWFPFAYTSRPFDHSALMFALKVRLDRALPNHFYQIEPQSLQYLTHGDLWDYLFLAHRAELGAGTMLPLTLEMGSWLWIKKNPRQIFSALGVFNPMLPHRLQRTLRRHHALLDFLLRIAASHDNWGDPLKVAAANYGSKADALWYSPGLAHAVR